MLYEKLCRTISSIILFWIDLKFDNILQIKSSSIYKVSSKRVFKLLMFFSCFLLCFYYI